MQTFVHIDKDREIFWVDGNFGNLEISKQLYKKDKNMEPICFAIEHYNENMGNLFAGFSLDKIKELQLYLDNLVKWFEEE